MPVLILLAICALVSVGFGLAGPLGSTRRVRPHHEPSFWSVR